MYTGTIQNAVKLNILTQKWEQKKNSGNMLSKQELKEKANWTPEQRQLNDFKEQLEKEKEGQKRTAIANKVSSGQKLTPEEEQYMSSYDPQGLADYKQTQNERKAYEQKLKNCKTKDEVKQLKTTTLGNHLASLKKIVNNPVIPLSEKLKKAQQILGKTKNMQAAEDEFIESGKYEELPTEAELAGEISEEKTEEKAEATKTDFEIEKNESSESGVKPDDFKEAAVEIQEIYEQLNQSVQTAAAHEKVETENKKQIGEKLLGKNVDLSI